jgi:hypothetical protein
MAASILEALRISQRSARCSRRLQKTSRGKRFGSSGYRSMNCSHAPRTMAFRTRLERPRIFEHYARRNHRLPPDSKEIIEFGNEYVLGEIGFDPWNATQLATELSDEDGFIMVQMRQTYQVMSEPMKKVMAQVRPSSSSTAATPSPSGTWPTWSRKRTPKTPFGHGRPKIAKSEQTAESL